MQEVGTHAQASGAAQGEETVPMQRAKRLHLTYRWGCGQLACTCVLRWLVPAALDLGIGACRKGKRGALGKSCTKLLGKLTALE